MATNLNPTEPSVWQSAEAVAGVRAERPLRQQSSRKTSTAAGKDNRIASKPAAATKAMGLNSSRARSHKDARPEEVT